MADSVIYGIISLQNLCKILRFIIYNFVCTKAFYKINILTCGCGSNVSSDMFCDLDSQAADAARSAMYEYLLARLQFDMMPQSLDSTRANKRQRSCLFKTQCCRHGCDLAGFRGSKLGKSATISRHGYRLAIHGITNCHAINAIPKARNNPRYVSTQRYREL